MIRIEVWSEPPHFSEYLCSQLRSDLFLASPVHRRPSGYVLRVHPRVPADVLRWLKKRMWPLRPRIQRVNDLPVDVQLWMGCRGRLALPSIKLLTPVDEFDQRFKELLLQMGFPVEHRQVKNPSVSIYFGGTPRVYIDQVRWLAAQIGVLLPEDRCFAKHDLRFNVLFRPAASAYPF